MAKSYFPRRVFFKSGLQGIMAVAAGTLVGFDTPPLFADPQQSQPPKGVALTKEWQETLTPQQIIALAKKGNERFSSGQPIQRDYLADVKAPRRDNIPPPSY